MMKRVPFSQVLKNASIDIRREYDRLYSMFYIQKFADGIGHSISMRDSCSSNFINFSFRGTCVSLDDFDNFYGYSFEKKPPDFNLDYLISFCEYSYNLVVHNQGYSGTFLMELHQSMQLYIKQVLQVIESVAYMANTHSGVIEFVPKDQVAISVAEMVDSTLSYRVIEYNHHSMKGDLERKRATLIALADKLEPNRKKLKEFNNALDSDLFYLLNSVKVRHNNTDQGGKNLNNTCNSNHWCFVCRYFHV